MRKIHLLILSSFPYGINVFNNTYIVAFIHSFCNVEVHVIIYATIFSGVTRHMAFVGRVLNVKTFRTTFTVRQVSLRAARTVRPSTTSGPLRGPVAG